MQERAAGNLAAASPADVPTHEAIDPVCGMTVDVASAVYRSTFEDTTYYFCSAGCLTRSSRMIRRGSRRPFRGS